MEIEWTETAVEDMAALDRSMARRVKQSVERFAETASTRLNSAFASAIIASAFARKMSLCGSSASAIGAKPTAGAPRRGW